MMTHCTPVDIITAVTALVVAIATLLRQFQHERNVDQAVNGAGDGTPPAGGGKAAP